MSAGRIVERGSWAMLRNESLCKLRGLRKAEIADPRSSLPAICPGSACKTDNTDAVFSASGMSFVYDSGKTIFKDVSFSVPQGITALIGANGTGKTTLARILTGLNKAEGGFAVQGRPVGREGLMPSAGLVLQNADQQLQMRTVREEVESAFEAGLCAKRTGFWSRLSRPRLTNEDRQKCARILSDLRLASLAERHPQSLSGGEKQRVVIACALAKDPSILILDEPTSGLDGANMAAIASLLRAEADKGRAVFLITHDLELLSSCDRALHMQDLQCSAA